MADIVHKTQTLPNGAIFVPYEAALAYTGNATPITGSSVSSGSLPPGLALDAVAPFTRITGVPTQDGVFTFQVTLTDAAGSVASPPLTIRITVPGIDEDLNYPASAEVKQSWPLS